MRAQIVKKVDMESARGRKKRNPLNDLRREVAIMRTLRHKNIVALQVHVKTGHEFLRSASKCPGPTQRGASTVYLQDYVQAHVPEKGGN